MGETFRFLPWPIPRQSGSSNLHRLQAIHRHNNGDSAPPIDAPMSKNVGGHAFAHAY